MSEFSEEEEASIGLDLSGAGARALRAKHERRPIIMEGSPGLTTCNPPESIYCGGDTCPICKGFWEAVTKESPFTLSDLIRAAGHIIRKCPEAAHWEVEVGGGSWPITTLKLDIPKKKVRVR